jgi:hypothetical protein
VARDDDDELTRGDVVSLTLSTTTEGSRPLGPKTPNPFLSTASVEALMLSAPPVADPVEEVRARDWLAWWW